MGRFPCCDDNSALKKGPWTPQEDEKLVTYIQNHGHGNWRALPKAAGLNRCGKSCRLRWTNYLRPGIKRGRFTQDDEDLIIKLHSVLGNKWSKIAAHLPGRTDNEIKNYWNTQLRKKLLQMGIDPFTHKPRTELNILANISQFLTNPSNLGPLVNPWDINNALRLQPNVATEVAKLQVLQNIVEIMNTNIMPSNLGFIPNLNGSSSISNYNNTTNAICSSSQEPCQLPKYISSNQEIANKSYDNNQEFYQSLDNDKFNCEKSLSSTTTSITTYETLNESRRLPSLINISSESSIVNQMEGNTKSTTGDFLQGWEKLLDDAGSDFWKEFIN